MAQACPINFTTADNTVSRTISLLSAVTVSLFFVSGQVFWLYALGADLLVRLYGNKHYSPLYQAASGLKQLLHLPTMHVDGAAKKVAGHFGLLFIVLQIAANHLGLHYMFDAVAGIYLLCLLMDVAFNFCVGCKVYYLYCMTVGQR